MLKKLLKAKPDLIVVDAMDKNIKNIKNSANSPIYIYNHKEILKEIGKLTNNEDKAKNGLKSGKIKLEKIKRNSK